MYYYLLPTLVYDGNINNNEYSQKRPVDLFFYFNKISNIINEINKIIEKMNSYKKRDNINNEEKDDIKEHKDKEGYLNMNNFIPFSFNELEIIQITAQMIPILDRCGRLMSDLSLLLSHTIFNPNLYPHLLLGHINNEISDSMSCTSGYSMLTNESNSLLSGFTNNFIFRQDRDILNNLRPIARNNNLSRTNVRDFTQNNNININTNTIKPTNIAKNTNISNNNSSKNLTTNINNINNNINSTLNNNVNNNNNNINNINNNINNINNNNSNQFSRPHYFINSSNSELPFIQRLSFNNSMHQNYINNLNLTNNNNQNPFDTFPKINLQIPPLLSPNQNSLVQQGGFNALEEQNNIYLLNNHIFVDNSNNNINNMNYINIINNNSVDRNQNQNDNISEDNYEPQYLNSNLNTTFNNNIKSLHLHLPRRKNSGTSCKTNKSADQMYTYQYKQFKIDKEQNDLMKNLNKDPGYYDSLSMKSDKVIPMKNKNFSYKSVSEVDEFGEFQNKNDEDEEEDNKKKDNNTYTSRKSVESGYYKDFLDEDNSTGNNNINYNNINISNNNSNNNFQNNK